MATGWCWIAPAARSTTLKARSSSARSSSPARRRFWWTRPTTPLHGQGNPRAAGSGRPYDGAHDRYGERAHRAAGRTAVRFPRRAARGHPACGTASYAASSPATGWSGLRGLPVELDVAPSSAIARPRSTRAILRSLCRSPARRPIPLPRCATPRRRATHAVRGQRDDLTIARSEKRGGVADARGPEIGVASTKAFTCR